VNNIVVNRYIYSWNNFTTNWHQTLSSNFEPKHDNEY